MYYAQYNVLHLVLFTLVHCPIISMTQQGQDFKQMKPRMNRRHPLNTHLGRSAIAKGISKQNSHPL